MIHYYEPDTAKVAAMVSMMLRDPATSRPVERQLAAEGQVRNRELQYAYYAYVRIILGGYGI